MKCTAIWYSRVSFLLTSPLKSKRTRALEDTGGFHSQFWEEIGVPKHEAALVLSDNEPTSPNKVFHFNSSTNKL